MRPLRQMSHVAWSVYLCVRVRQMGDLWKTPELIEMPFGG